MDGNTVTRRSYDIDWNAFRDFLDRETRAFLDDFFSDLGRALTATQRQAFSYFIQTSFIQDAYLKFLLQQGHAWPEVRNAESFVSIFSDRSAQSSAKEPTDSPPHIDAIEEASIPTGDIVDLHFFHRHDAFKNKCRAIFDFTASGLKTGRKESIVDTPALDNLCSSWSPLLKTDVGFFLNNYRLFDLYRPPKVILVSAHGHVSSSGRLLVSFAKAMGARIVVLQLGLIRGIAEFVGQTEFEDRIADYFLTWGENLNVKNPVPMGSLYGLKGKEKTRSAFDAIVLLPPVPTRPFPRPFSFFWGQSTEEFLAFDVERIATCIEEFRNDNSVQLRCKSVDAEFYKGLMADCGMPEERLDSGDVNQNEYFSLGRTMYAGYISSGIAEAHYAGMEVEPVFSMDWYRLKEPAHSLVTKILSSPSKDRSHLDEFMDRFAKSADESTSPKMLGELVQSLTK